MWAGVAAAIVALGGAHPIALAAQAPAGPAALVDSGDVVRLTSALPTGGRRVGHVAGWAADTLRFVPRGGGVVETVPLALVARLERGAGPQPRGRLVAQSAGVGFLIGGGIGVALTAIGALSDARNPCYDCFITATAAGAIVGVGTTLLGTVVGTVAGLVRHAPERWARVPLPGRMGVRPTGGVGGRGGVALTVAF